MTNNNIPKIRSWDMNPRSRTHGKVLDYDGHWKSKEDILPLMNYKLKRGEE
jgi:hypothetical protein